MVEHGPWGGGRSGAGRVGPPEREAIPGIAKLFGTTPARVAEMIAADWYGVRTEADVSERVLNFKHLIDALDSDDVLLVDRILRRLRDSDEPLLGSSE